MSTGQHQPLDRVPNLTEDTYVLAALNKGVLPMGNAYADYGPAGNDGTPAGSPLQARVGISCEGVDDTVDYGDLGNTQQVVMWVNPGTTTEQLFLVDAGNYVHVVGGTITYVGLAAAATYVNGVVGTAIAADEWSRVVCQFTQIDANNFELAVDGAGNFGDIEVKDLRVTDSVWSAARVAYDYAEAIPDDDLRLSLDGRGVDLTRYGLEFTRQADVIVGHEQSYDGTGDYLDATAAAWRSADSLGTLEAWVRPADITKGMAIFASADEGTDDYLFEWILTAAGVQYVYALENTVVVGAATGTTAMLQDVWQHLVVVSTGSAYLFYRNGVLDAVAGGGTDSGAWLADVTLRDNVTVGGLEYNSGLVLPWEGQISTVKYYSRVMSAGEVAQRYAREEGRY